MSLCLRIQLSRVRWISCNATSPLQRNGTPIRWEKVDSAIGGVAAQLLDQNEAESVTVYTADKAARRGIEVALTKYGYGDRIKTVDTFALQREAREKYGSR